MQISCGEYICSIFCDDGLKIKFETNLNNENQNMVKPLQQLVLAKYLSMP